MYPCVAILVCLCVCTTPYTAFNGYMLLNIIETGLPLDTLHRMEKRLGIAEQDAFGGHIVVAQLEPLSSWYLLSELHQLLTLNFCRLFTGIHRTLERVRTQMILVMSCNCGSENEGRQNRKN